MFIQITQVWVHYFKLFNRVQSTQDEKARFIKGNELKLTQIELFSFFFFKRVLVCIHERISALVAGSPNAYFAKENFNNLDVEMEHLVSVKYICIYLNNKKLSQLKLYFGKP